MQVYTHATTTPQRTIVHGVSGVGKTTFAAQSPAPIFIATEDGCNYPGMQRFDPRPTSFDDVIRNLGEAYSDEHDFQTLVIDSLDWTEKLIFAAVCEANRVKTIADIDWGRGYLQALSYWRTLTEGLDALRANRGMSIILIAHTVAERFEDPETNGYDRYTMKLHKAAREHLIEWADNVLFACYDVRTREAEGKFNKKVAKAIGGDRILRTTQRPAAIAKNRLGLPDEIPLDWNVFSSYLK